MVFPGCHRPSAYDQRQQQQQLADASTPASSSLMSTAFEFLSAPSDDSMPSFDPTIAAFTDISFTRPAVPSTSLQVRTSLSPAARQLKCFRRPELSSHDRKRVKDDPGAPILDSIDYWIRFGDDVDNIGSLEIDYSKCNDPTGLNGTGAVTSTMPGLGSGLYSTAMAPFGEDFIDDVAYDDQALSDDEDIPDVEHIGDQPSGTESQSQLPVPPSVSLPQPSHDEVIDDLVSLTRGGRAHFGLRLNPALEETPRQMRQDIWGTPPRGMNQVLSLEEQRRLLEISLNSGQMPASFIPPNGFGLGFGAGLGARPPAEFGQRAGRPPSTTMETAPTGTSSGVAPRDEEEEEQEQAVLKLPLKRPAASKPGMSKKPPEHALAETVKPRPADRIAHNEVERKYRTNLKVKIAELRDAVPALQPPALGTDAAECGPGQQDAPKVRKGTVLAEATEYIQQLEQRNRAIVLEHQQLARRLQAFETLFDSTIRQPDLMTKPSMALFDPRGFC
ncbi:helix-loop-helix DNA-binding domain-containing protein [Hirsutella rhossiliensis]|uniref:Helix-loop-helix DNA-binding domain-containing protein n=1 Tax=Hirsutella rhossiliensis TaxID=111463 RepID=A0A9P8N8Q1_9HYPO|nr:helix-loop-helix DNA-binding domain-containing protein [Hirsutella rhossiliensis]KAH0968784.1 helix-loop-helix DNA-binding domain-containing protein [Hirsutella rhossiliensis]